MAPLLVTALVGVGVKVATDLLMAGAKEIFKTSGATSFASALDKARTPVGPTAALPAAKAFAPDAGLAERSRLLAAEAPSSLPAATFAHGTDSYRRLSEIQAI